MTIDSLTQAWIRNEADARAAVEGCRFSLERACWTVWWVERYCRLYEGEWAGQPMILRGAHSQSIEAIFDPFYREDGEPGLGCKLSIQRARDYMDAVAAGEPCDWQYEVTMRLYGWERHSERWKRMVRRFQEAVVVVAKKNKKSPTISAWSLFNLCGDGEPGQKVFLAAKDGTQVRKNMGLHILNMIEQSPELKVECKINLNEMSVAHLPTRSMLIPLSSSNERTQKSKEGLNGSLSVDEMHVVDRDFMKRLTRMGISRSEPLRIEVTTSGNDPDGYGHERCEYARAVLDGIEVNQRLFTAIYEAPQNVTDSELNADPEKYGRMANPAWGHTIYKDEYLADYSESKRTISALADFKMYRLNVWQRSSNPWIRADDWVKCRKDFTEEDLLGMPCGAALDLGKTDDMSAFSLVFPEDMAAWTKAAGEATAAMQPRASESDEEVIASQFLMNLEQPVKVLTWYWLPDAAIERKTIDANYAQWVRDGWLTLTNTTSANTTDPTAILADIRTLLKRYRVQMFAYDPWYASGIIGALQNQDGFHPDYCWPFSQTIKSYAFPASLFERLVLSGKLHHDGNPITTWEAGHVQVKADNNGNIRPVKPLRQDQKKIDGIVSLVMGLDAAMRLLGTYSIYEERGVLSV